ncbi:MAG: MBL fold metallo-hydrolase [Thermoleophilia bacterium]|jgi:hydroxyacylglutathione hydrolase
MHMRCLPVGPLQANCYLIWDDDLHACAVDPGGESERIARYLSDEGLTLDAILLTHGHFDHAEGVKGLAERTGAKVYCSPLVAPVLTGPDGCDATGYPIPSVDADTVEVVDEGATVVVNSFSVTVIATPGHTPGDLTFEIDGHLFCGDLLFYRSVGRTDFPGGDFPTLLRSVAKLAERYPASTPVHPGHMQSTTLGEELRSNPFLESLDVDA